MFEFVLSLTLALMRPVSFLVAALLMTYVTVSAPLSASTFFDTFGPDVGTSTGDNNAFNTSVALEFTPMFSATVGSAQIAASGLNTSISPVSGTILFDIRNDSNGLPGNTIIDSFTFPDVSVSGVYTAFSMLHPILQAGTPYWFVMEAAADPTMFFATWNVTSPSQSGTVAFEVGNGGWFFDGLGVPAARLTAIPEPKLDLLTALSIAGFAWSRFRSRNVA
jgi:hypothetical protein